MMKILRSMLENPGPRQLDDKDYAPMQGKVISVNNKLCI